MKASSIARIKCFILLQGLEQSLASNLSYNYRVTDSKFLSPEEEARALERFRNDIGDVNWQLEDLQEEDLIHYLDLGDLVGLLNRHISSAVNIKPEHIRAVSKAIEESSALSVRKRVMHTVRPLEPDDLANLMTLATNIRRTAPSLIWDPLIESLNMLSSSSEGLLDISIPGYWVEEPPIIQNLPPAEFDDTGFIGRKKERKDLKSLLESDHKVITVVAEGGKGKTALALRVCNDLLEENISLFERMIWVSLKTRFLTPSGIQQITDAIDSAGSLIDRIFEILDLETDSLTIAGKPRWDQAIEQLKATKTLLIIDNLETIGEAIRDLIIRIPTGSKVLITSRVGFGEVELRYPLADLQPVEATHLFRSLVNIYGYSLLKRLSGTRVGSYCQQLGYNPLLIKWFVQAVGRGADPAMLVSTSGFDEALKFCYSNVYDQLSTQSKLIVSVLLASRRVLTKSQLQYLTSMDHVQFTKASQDLVCSSFVDRVFIDDNTVAFQIHGLLYEYLSRNHPPENELVISTRKIIKEWQAEQDQSTSQAQGYRYSSDFLLIETADERISAQHLRRAMKAARIRDFDTANNAIIQARELNPTWGEIYRISAAIMEAQGKPIYEVEEAFEQSIACKDTDITRFQYASYLMRHSEYDRVVNNINEGLKCKEAIPSSMRSLKGVALVRLGRIQEGIEELTVACEYNKSTTVIPNYVKRVHLTQLSDAYCRNAERLHNLGNLREASDVCTQSIKIIDDAIELYGTDHQIVETAVSILATMLVCADPRELDSQSTIDTIKKWDNSEDFLSSAIGFRKTASHLERLPQLESLLPNVARSVKAFEPGKHYTGRIRNINKIKSFGFISCGELGNIHFNRNSLIDQTQWQTLEANMEVTFGVTVPLKRSLHAVYMKRS